jgi:hypothetical protein
MVNPPIPLLGGTALSLSRSLTPTTSYPAIVYLQTIAGVVGAAAAVTMCFSKCLPKLKSKRRLCHDTEETENDDIEESRKNIINKIINVDRSDTSTITTMNLLMSSRAQFLVKLNTNDTTTVEIIVHTTSTPAVQLPIEQFDRLETQSYRSFLTGVFKSKSMKSMTDKSVDESAFVKSNTNTKATVETTVDTAATPVQPQIEQLKQLETQSLQSFLTEVFKGKSMKSITDKSVDENALVKSNTKTTGTEETIVDTTSSPAVAVHPPTEQLKQLETQSYRSFLTEVFKFKSMKSITDKYLDESESVGRVIGADLL